MNNGALRGKTRYGERLRTLWTQRDALMQEIALRERSGPLPPMFAKARTFLVHFWAKSDWTGREEILVTARWLVGIGAAQDVLPPAKDKRRARRKKVGAPRHPRNRAAKASAVSR